MRKDFIQYFRREGNFVSKIISEEGLKNIIETNKEVINGNADDIEGIK